MKNCFLCGVVLQKGESFLCNSCFVFVEWKYGSVDKYRKVRRKALKMGGGGKR